MKEAVAIIIDPKFGVKLRQIPSNMAIWVCKSEGNELAAEEIRQQAKKMSDSRSVTVFNFDESSTRTQTCTDILHDVALHHSWKTLDVYGVSLTDELKPIALAELESAFDEKIPSIIFESTEFGFRISR